MKKKKSNMKKKKGFTLVELMGSIVVIIIIVTLALTSYQGIALRLKTNTYDNKIKLIEAAAANYANDTGNVATNVDQLVKEGYIEADNESGKVYDPRDNSEMNCNIVVSEEDKGNYYGKYTNEKECNFENLKSKQENANLGIDVYRVDENGNRTTEKLDTNIWTGEDVELAIIIKNNEFSEKEINSIVWYNNIMREEYKDGNIKSNYRITSNSIINTTYTVIVTLNNGLSYQAKINIKIDKQKPIIYTDGLNVETTSENGGWINRPRNLKVSANDGEGSGIYGYALINWNDKCENQSINIFKKDDSPVYDIGLKNGDYRVCVRDNAGNIAGDGDETKVKKIKINQVDTQKPECTLTLSGAMGSNGWYNNNVTVTLSGEDIEDTANSGGKSGIKSRVINGYNTNPITITTDTNGLKIIGTVTDVAGNVATCEKDLKLDKTPPTCNYNGASTSWTSGNRTITTTCSDSGSGCKENYRRVDNITSTMQYARLPLTIYDNAGNVSNCGNSVNVYVDKCDNTRNSCGGWISCDASCGRQGTGTRNCSRISNLTGWTCSNYVGTGTCDGPSCPAPSGGGGGGGGDCNWICGKCGVYQGGVGSFCRSCNDPNKPCCSGGSCEWSCMMCD